MRFKDNMHAAKIDMGNIKGTIGQKWASSNPTTLINYIFLLISYFETINVEIEEPRWKRLFTSSIHAQLSGSSLVDSIHDDFSRCNR